MAHLMPGAGFARKDLNMHVRFAEPTYENAKDQRINNCRILAVGTSSIQMTKTFESGPCRRGKFKLIRLGHSNFSFRICFGFGHSDFGFVACKNVCPAAVLRQLFLGRSLCIWLLES